MSGYSQWARTALEQYPLRVSAGSARLRFLGHSENLTFRVEDADGSVYLLRLHHPVIAYFGGARQKPEMIASELLWLETLVREGGFDLQKPVRSRQGELVTLIQPEAGSSPTPCTLLTWLEGAHFSPAAPDALDLIRRFGALVAQMHNFASSWQPPEGFTRPRYDRRYFQRLFARLLRGVDLGVFSEDVYRIFRAVSLEVLGEIEALPRGPGSWGMIHADLHVGNFLVSGGKVFPIDFSFCGFGHYLYDVSICLVGGLKYDLRRAFLEGYRGERALPESARRAVESFALASALNYYAYQIDNPAEQNWLKRRLPDVAAGICQKYLRKEEILYEL